jgi:hypothetical protein
MRNTRRRNPGLLLLSLLLCPSAPAGDHPVTKYGAVPDDGQPDTAALQAAIEACAKEGGGSVRFPRGRFLSGGLRMRDHVRLVFEKDAVLQGSDNCMDYGGKAQWGDALITGRNLKNAGFEGPGLIDGADCKNPKGEEGFRGPHGILLEDCSGVTFKDITLARTGNYAVLCYGSSGVEFRNVSFRGGHDGIHAQGCRKFRIADCDFRTGDDCLAGCDDEDFEVTGCRINSSCNGFRLGCKGLRVRKCAFWGPGEALHQVSKRTNMLSAFVHFAPKDRNPKLPSDDWLVEDCTVDNVDFLYGYDFDRGLWQTGQPAKRLAFRNVKATRVAHPVRIRGDKDRQFELILDGVSIALREDRKDREVLNLTRFGALLLRRVTLTNGGHGPVLKAREGKTVWLDRVTCVPENAAPFAIEEVETTRKDALPDAQAGPR